MEKFKVGDIVAVKGPESKWTQYTIIEGTYNSSGMHKDSFLSWAPPGSIAYLLDNGMFYVETQLQLIKSIDDKGNILDFTTEELKLELARRGE